MLADRVVDLTGEGFEAAIRIGALADSALVARQLAPYRLIACATPEYIARHGVPASPAGLAAHDDLGFDRCTRPLVLDWPTADGIQALPASMLNRLSINDSRAQLAAAREGLGVVLGAEIMLSEDIANGRLVRLLADYEAPTRPVYIVFQRDRHMTPKLRAFIDLVVEAFPQAA